MVQKKERTITEKHENCRFQEEIKCASMFMAFQVDERTFKVCSILGMSDSEPEDPDKGRNYFITASIGEASSTANAASLNGTALCVVTY